jgi:hypothetical protein
MAEFKLGRIKFVYQGAWTPTTAYVVDDVVTVGGKTYICTVSNTSSAVFGTDLTSNYWSTVADGSRWVGNWAISTYYQLGDQVLYGGIVYQCTTAHTSAGSTASGLEANQGNWVAFASNLNWLGAWAINTRYKVRDLISYGGYTYVCNTYHTSAATTALGLEADQSKWDTFNPGFAFQGAWSGSSVKYRLNDIVKYGASLWICTTAHTSSASFATSNFSIFVNGIQYAAAAWSGSTTYVTGDIVGYGGNLYIATQIALNQNPVTQTAFWTIVASNFSFQGDWSGSTSYKVGQVVRQGGYTYLAIADNTQSVLTASATTVTTNIITLSTITTALVANMPVVFGTTFGGLTAGIQYFVIGSSITSSTFQVATTPGGVTPVTLSTTTGQSVTATLQSQPPFATYWTRLNSGIRWNAQTQVYNGVSGTNITAVGSSATFNVTLSGTYYTVAVAGGGSGYGTSTTLKILGSNLGGVSPANDITVTITGVSSGAITTVTQTGFSVTWKSGTTYVLGDVVYYGANSYICINAHVGGSGNKPDADVVGAFWNVLASGAESAVLTTQGDTFYYGAAGPTRLPIGTDGQILRVNNNLPAWSYYGQINNIVYVSPAGADVLGNGQGQTLDKPWATIRYACAQIEDGYLNTNAKMLLTMNKQFLIKEVNNFVLNKYSVTVTSSSTTVFTASAINNLYAGMPISFSGTTFGGITAGTTYYVCNISGNNFGIASSYANALAPTAIALSASSGTMIGSYVYSRAKTERDAGLIVDGLIKDISRGGNYYTTVNIQAYFATTSSYISGVELYDINPFVASMVYLNTISANVLANTAPAVNYQTSNNTPLATASASATGGTATVGFASQTTVPYAVGSYVTIAGLTPTAFNGTWLVTASTTSAVSFALAGTLGPQTIAGTISPARALQQINTSYTAEATGSAQVSTLLTTIIQTISAGTTVNLPATINPNTTVSVKTGTYNEVLPIVVPAYTAIVGDELRSTVVQPQPAIINLTNDKPKSINSLQRIQSLIPTVMSNSVVTASVGNLQVFATTAASGTGTVATLTFAAQSTAPFVAGQYITINGVTPTGYNGSGVVTACTTTSVSYSNTTTGSQSVAGTVSSQVTGLPISDVGYVTGVNSVNTLTQMINDMIFNGTVKGPAFVLPTVTGYNTSALVGFGDARTQITNNYNFIKAEIAAFLNVNYNAVWTSGGTYQSDMIRDVGFILDGLQYDLGYGCNNQSLINGSSYYSLQIPQISTTNRPATLAAFQRISAIVSQIATTASVTTSAGNSATQSTSGTAGSATAAAFAAQRIQDIIYWVNNGTGNSSTQSFTASISTTVLTVTATSSIIVPGVLLTGTGVTAGTFITNQATATNSAAAATTLSSGGVTSTNTFVVSSAAGIVAGQFISGTGLPPGSYVSSSYAGGTTITVVNYWGAPQVFGSTGSGAYLFYTPGNTGTYTVSTTQTVSSTTLTSNNTFTPVQSGVSALQSAQQQTAYNLLTARQSEIAADAQVFVSKYNHAFNISGTLSNRDAGYITTALAYDILFGSNFNSITCGRAFNRQNTSALAVVANTNNQLYATTDTITFIGFKAKQYAATGASVQAQTLIDDVISVIDGQVSTTLTTATTSTNLLTVSSTAGMRVNMPIKFTGLPTATVTTATATTVTTNLITLASATGIAVGQQIYFTGAVFGNIVQSQMYYVLSLASTNITVSLTFGGAAVTLVTASGTMTATSTVSGGIWNNETYWINTIPSGTTLTITDSYKSGTAYTITRTVGSMTATAVAGDTSTALYLNNPMINGTLTYNNTFTTINGAEILRANIPFLAAEAAAYTNISYGGGANAVTNTTVTTNVITTSSAHGFVIGDPVIFSGTTFGGVTAGVQYWVLTRPSTTQFTITTTQATQGTQSTVVLSTASGTCTVNYFYNYAKCVRDTSSYITAFVNDLLFTGNYRSMRAVELYLNAVRGSAASNLYLVRNSCGVRNMTMNGLTGTLSSANAYGTKRPTGGAYTSLDPGFGPNDANAWIYARSTYVQNCTMFGYGISGAKVDGALHNGGYKSMVANDYTCVIGDGIGWWNTGTGSLAELVSVFNYYCYAGYLSELGGRIRATNGNSSYGTYGTVAEGVDTFETPIFGTVNNRAYGAQVTQVVTDSTTQILRLEFANAGRNYYNAVPTLSGSGYNILTNQDEYRDAGTFETRIIDPTNTGSSGGTNYVTAVNVGQQNSLGVGYILIAAADNALTDAYNGMKIQITAGTGVGQVANILKFENSSKYARIVRPSFATLTVTATSITNNLLTVASTSTLYVGMPIFLDTTAGGLTANTVYYVITANFSTTQFAVSTTLGGSAVTISANLSAQTIKLYNAGWDHIVPGTPVTNATDLTTAYIIEPNVSYTAPGFTATQQTLPSTAAWKSMAYGQGRFVAVSLGATNTATSTNGKTWTSGGALTASVGWQSVVYGGGENATATVVLGGFGGSGAVLTAVVGSGLTANQIIGVTVVQGGYNYTTPPTITFTPVNGGTGATATCSVLNGVIQAVVVSVNGSGYLAAPTVNVVTSTVSTVTPISYGKNYYNAPNVVIDAPFSGTVWSSGGSSTAGNYYYYTDTGVTPNKTNYYLAGGTGTFSALAPTFTTGVGSSGSYGVTLTYVGTQATVTTTITNYAVSAYAVSVGGFGYTFVPTITITDLTAKFVAISGTTANTAYNLPTTLANSWTAGGNLPSTNFLALVYGGGVYVAVGGSGGTSAIASSPDGITWTSRTAPAGATQTYSGVAYGPTGYGNASTSVGLFVAITTGSNITAYSTNGTTWTRGGDLPSSTTWSTVKYGNGRFVALATGTTTVAYSYNGGANWYTSTSAGSAGLPISQSWTGLAYGQGQFLATASGATPTVTATSSSGNLITLTSTAGININNTFVPTAVTQSTSATTTATGAATFNTSTISGTTLTLTWVSGTVAVGMIITGGTTTAGTYIVSNLSGVGTTGVSTWTVNTSQTTSGATTGTNNLVTVASTTGMIPGESIVFTGNIVNTTLSQSTTGTNVLTVGTTAGFAVGAPIVFSAVTYSGSITATSSTGNTITPSSLTGLTAGESIVFTAVTQTPTITATTTASGIQGIGYISGTTLTLSSVTTPTFQIGTAITGAGVTAGTYITGNLTGTGSTASTWTVNNSQTAGSSGSPIVVNGTTNLITLNNVTALVLGQSFIPASSVGGLTGATTYYITQIHAGVTQIAVGSSFGATTNVTLTTTTSQSVATTCGSVFGNIVSGTTYYINGVSSPNITISASYGGAQFTIANGAGAWTFVAGTVFGGITSGTTYFVSTIDSGTTLKISATYLGGVFAVTGGNGAWSVQEGASLGGISSGTTYYITQVVNSTLLAVSTTFGGANLTLTTGAGSWTAQAGTVFGNLVSNNTYYVTSVVGNQITVSSTLQGSTFVLVNGAAAWTSTTGNSVAATSWDGINWTQQTLPTTVSWGPAAFGNPIQTTIGFTPIFALTSTQSGTVAASIQTGATALGRVKVTSNAVNEIRMVEPGSGYAKGVVSATTTSTNLITVDQTINMYNNQPIEFSVTIGGLAVNTTYYVIGATITSTQFKVASVSGSSTPVTLSTTAPTGMTYTTGPIITVTDPSRVLGVLTRVRTGDGVLGNPSFANRGAGNATATASYTGDGFAELFQNTAFINISGLFTTPQPGANVQFATINNAWYKLVAVTNLLGSAGNYTATFQVSPSLTTFYAPPHGTLITTRLRYSQVRLTGHDFLYIGTGNQTQTNYPNVNPAAAIAANQTLPNIGGRVFFTSTDQDGNFNVGNLFGVQQATGTASLNANAFNLAGLQSLTLGAVSIGVGSATITQFSTDPYFTANSDNIVPTQKAIKSFITAQIGGGSSSLNVNTLTAGSIFIAGNSISNKDGTAIYVTSKMTFVGGVDGAPVALTFFCQR